MYKLSLFLFFFFIKACLNTSAENPLKINDYECKNCGVIQKGWLHDFIGDFENTFEYSEDFMKTFFWDSAVIFEISKSKIITDIHGRVKKEKIIEGYLFHDIRTKAYYMYCTFDEAAPIHQAFLKSDTSLFYGIYNFKRGFQPSLLSHYSIVKHSDTTIKYNLIDKALEVNYKVLNLESKMIDEDFRPAVIYLSKDYIPRFFTLDKEITKKYKLPVTRCDFPLANKDSSISYESSISFLERNFLTESEVRVFNAWTIYAFNHPLAQ